MFHSSPAPFTAGYHLNLLSDYWGPLYLEAEIEQRKALAEQLAEVTKRATSTADQLAHEKVSGQACQARLEAAAREIASANEAAATARAAAKKSGEEAAELRGQLATVSNVTTVKTVKKQPVKKGA